MKCKNCNGQGSVTSAIVDRGRLSKEVTITISDGDNDELVYWVHILTLAAESKDVDTRITSMDKDSISFRIFPKDDIARQAT